MTWDLDTVELPVVQRQRLTARQILVGMLFVLALAAVGLGSGVIVGVTWPRGASHGPQPVLSLPPDPPSWMPGDAVAGPPVPLPVGTPVPAPASTTVRPAPVRVAQPPTAVTPTSGVVRTRHRGAHRRR